MICKTCVFGGVILKCVGVLNETRSVMVDFKKKGKTSNRCGDRTSKS